MHRLQMADSETSRLSCYRNIIAACRACFQAVAVAVAVLVLPKASPAVRESGETHRRQKDASAALHLGALNY